MTTSNTTFNFSDSKLGKLQPPPKSSPRKQNQVTDKKLGCLKAEISKNGTITFWFRKKYKGRSFTYRIGTFPAINVETARTRALEMLARVEMGLTPVAETEAEPVKVEMTVREFVERHYKEWALQNKRSANADFSKLNVHILGRWGDRPLKSITRRDVEEYLLELSKKGQPSGKPYKPSTLNRHLSFFCKFLGLAMEWGFIDQNPAKGIKSRKENNVKTTHLKANQIPLLFEKLDQDKNRVGVNAVKLLLLTGARTSEILFLHWTDYDPEAKTLFIRETKWGPARFLMLNTLGLAIVEEMKAYRNGPYIFPGAKEPLIKPYNNIKKPLARAMKKAGLDEVVPGFTPHCLRHSTASLLATKGASLYQIKEVLGHASVAMTQRYAHLCNHELRATSQIVADVLTSTKTVDSAVADSN
ncbi:MAG: tyrosine-type recombinase/integrase [Methylobacter sp.]